MIVDLWPGVSSARPIVNVCSALLAIVLSPFFATTFHVYGPGAGGAEMAGVIVQTSPEHMSAAG